MIHSEKIVQTIYAMPDGAKVHVVYIEYTGGGECFEFRIDNPDGTLIHRSDAGYGNASVAAHDAMIWFAGWGHGRLLAFIGGTSVTDHKQIDIVYRHIVECFGLPVLRKHIFEAGVNAGLAMLK